MSKQKSNKKEDQSWNSTQRQNKYKSQKRAEQELEKKKQDEKRELAAFKERADDLVAAIAQLDKKIGKLEGYSERTKFPVISAQEPRIEDHLAGVIAANDVCASVVYNRDESKITVFRNNARYIHANNCRDILSNNNNNDDDCKTKLKNAVAQEFSDKIKADRVKIKKYAGNYYDYSQNKQNDIQQFFNDTENKVETLNNVLSALANPDKETVKREEDPTYQPIKRLHEKYNESIRAVDMLMDNPEIDKMRQADWKCPEEADFIAHTNKQRDLQRQHSVREKFSGDGVHSDMKARNWLSKEEKEVGTYIGLSQSCCALCDLSMQATKSLYNNKGVDYRGGQSQIYDNWTVGNVRSVDEMKAIMMALENRRNLMAEYCDVLQNPAQHKEEKLQSIRDNWWHIFGNNTGQHFLDSLDPGKTTISVHSDVLDLPDKKFKYDIPQTTTTKTQKERILAGDFYDTQEFLDLIDPQPFIANNIKQLDDSLGTLISDDSGGVIVINVNAISGDIGTPNSNHWVGLKIYGKDKVIYVDPLGTEMHNNILTSLTNRGYSSKNIVHVFVKNKRMQHAETEILQGANEEVSILEGNTTDCGPFVIFAINELNKNDTNKGIEELKEWAANIQDTALSKEAGNNIRNNHVKILETKQQQAEHEITRTKNRSVSSSTHPMSVSLDPSLDEATAQSNVKHEKRIDTSVVNPHLTSGRSTHTIIKSKPDNTNSVTTATNTASDLDNLKNNRLSQKDVETEKKPADKTTKSDNTQSNKSKKQQNKNKQKKDKQNKNKIDEEDNLLDAQIKKNANNKKDTLEGSCNIKTQQDLQESKKELLVFQKQLKDVRNKNIPPVIVRRIKKNIKTLEQEIDNYDKRIKKIIETDQKDNATTKTQAIKTNNISNSAMQAAQNLGKKVQKTVVLDREDVVTVSSPAATPNILPNKNTKSSIGKY